MATSTKKSTSTIPQTKTVTFVNKNVKLSPRKLRLLVNDIKKLKPDLAITQLKFQNNRSARFLFQAIQSLINDAKNNHKLDPGTFVFSQMTVNDGPKFKRMDKAHGSRFARGLIQKRHSYFSASLIGNLSVKNESVKK
jgi:large subunit ribosomal protein L22